MAATNQTQGFLGGVLIGGKKYTVRGNPQFRANRNIDVTAMIGTGYPYLYSEGVQTPTFTCSLVGRNFKQNTATGHPFTPEFLAYFFARNATQVGTPLYNTAPVWETYTIGPDAPSTLSTLTLTDILAINDPALKPGIMFSDGETVTCIWGVKGESIRISTAKGQDLMVDCTFVGTAAKQYRVNGSGVTNAQLQAIANTVNECGMAPLRFQNVTFVDAWMDKVFGINVSWSNNHTPNMGLNGSLFPVAQNAGMPNAGLSLTLQALDAIPGDLQVDTSFGFYVTSTAGTATFSMPYCVVYNPYDRAAPMGRVLRNYNYTLLGSCATPNQSSSTPMLVSSTYVQS